MEVVSLVFADIPVVAGLQTWKCYMGEPELFQAEKRGCRSVGFVWFISVCVTAGDPHKKSM